jgi:hypothetical protein
VPALQSQQENQAFSGTAGSTPGFIGELAELLKPQRVSAEREGLVEETLKVGFAFGEV